MYIYYVIKIERDMERLLEELFIGYADGMITDVELNDMLDLVTNEYSSIKR